MVAMTFIHDEGFWNQPEKWVGFSRTGNHIPSTNNSADPQTEGTEINRGFFWVFCFIFKSTPMEEVGRILSHAKEKC